MAINNIVTPLDNNDINTGKNYLANKLTMNPDGSIDEARFAIGIFYEDAENKLLQATNIDEGFIIKKMPNNLATPFFTRTTENSPVQLTFYEGLQGSVFWIVLLLRDNFDSQLTPIFRKPFSSDLYKSGEKFTIDNIRYNLDFGDAVEHFVFS